MAQYSGVLSINKCNPFIYFPPLLRRQLIISQDTLQALKYQVIVMSNRIILPPEIIDKILLRVDVRIAISLGNEFVKVQLLPYQSRRRCWVSNEYRRWCEQYDVGSKAIPRFYLSSYLDGSVLLLIGRRRSGKSQLLRDLMSGGRLSH